MIRIRPAVVFLCSLLVGGTFLTAGVLKSLDVNGFARDIALHGIVGPGPAWFLARLLVPFEIVAGAAAILGYRRRLAIVLLMAALLVFIGATGYAWATGNTEGCGCFGRYAARTPASVIVEDLLLAAAGLLALLLGTTPGQVEPAAGGIGSSTQPGIQKAAEPRTRPGGSWRGACVAVLAAVSTLFALASSSLPIDNYVTDLHPGATIAGLGLDRIGGDLAEGDRLLVILVLDEPASREAVPALNALGQTPGTPPVTCLTSANDEKRAEFFWSYAPAFEFIEVPAPDLRRLYRRAPRTFRVHNGAVLHVWDGIPPLEELGR